MNGLLKILAVLVAVFVLTSANAFAAGAKNTWTRDNRDQEKTRVPGFSSPPVYTAGNGDRVSQYPPYFRPAR